jgi:hypothetical protein
MTEIIIKDSPGFQLRLKKWESINPKGLYAVHFIQATKDREGNVDSESTYEFFMDAEELSTLADALVK